MEVHFWRMHLYLFLSLFLCFPSMSPSLYPFLCLSIFIFYIWYLYIKYYINIAICIYTTYFLFLDISLSVPIYQFFYLHTCIFQSVYPSLFLKEVAMLHQIYLGDFLEKARLGRFLRTARSFSNSLGYLHTY